MRYWIYDERTKTVFGPHLVMALSQQPGFGPETKVAPEGAKGALDWKRAKDVEELKGIFSTPAAPAAPAEPKGEKTKG